MNADEALRLSAKGFYRKPNAICFVCGGAKENASEVRGAVYFANLLLDYYGDDVELRLVTNSNTWHGFPGEVYRAPRRDHDGNADVYRDLVGIAWVERWLIESDLVITYSWYAALLIRILGIERLQFRLRPTLVCMPKVRESGGGAVIDDSGMSKEDDGYNLFWKSVADGHVHVMVCDNDHEKKLAEGYINRAAPTACYDYLTQERHPIPMTGYDDERDPLIIWMGRINPVKNWKLGFDILTALHVTGTDVCVFTPQPLNLMKEGPQSVLDLQLPYHAGLGPSEYLEKAGRATAVIVTSGLEALGTGYLELAERGVIPILWKRPWNHTYLGEGYPLRFKSIDEAIDMTQAVLKDPDPYRKDVLTRLEERYPARTGAESNYAIFADRAWRSYLALGVEQEFGETWREGRLR